MDLANIENQDFNPLRVGLLLVGVLSLLFWMAWSAKLRNDRRPPVTQHVTKAYVRPSGCPFRDYSRDAYIYRGCANQKYRLDGYAYGIDPLDYGKTIHGWYRIGNDAYLLRCLGANDGACDNLAVVRNLFVQGPHPPPLSYYRMPLQ